MSRVPPPSPNPRRVAAGKRNRLRRNALCDEACERLRLAALANRPWQYSTGPKSQAGKVRSAANGKTRQKGPVSVRELRAELADVRSLVKSMRDLRLEYDRVRITDE